MAMEMAMVMEWKLKVFDGQGIERKDFTS